MATSPPVIANSNARAFSAKIYIPSRLATVEQRVAGIETNVTADSRVLENRVTAQETLMSQIMPAVKEIQVSVQCILKQQGGKP